jgi:xanthine dehydrogenase iron-sulfur cluster and FAD-binding subunit A
VLIALGATAVLLSRNGERRVPLEEFFVAYRRTALKPGEILGYVEIPALSPQARACAYKVSKRRELDISCVAAAFVVEVDAAGVATQAHLAYGGMAATPARGKKAEAEIRGQPWNEATVERAALALAEDFRPLDDHRGSARYRLKVAQNLLRGFFEETAATPLPRLQVGHSATVQVR